MVDTVGRGGAGGRVRGGMPMLTTADKVFNTVGSVGLAGFSVDAAVKEHKKPKKDRATYSKHETSVMKKNKASAKAKAQDGRNPDEKYSY